MNRTRVLLWFVDGLGVGECDPRVNPVVRARTPGLDRMLAGRLCWATLPVRNGGCWATAVDATLGVVGLPQSATGQTALLTGINAAALQGRHVTAYPTRALRALLDEHSLFHRARRAGLRVAFANAFTDDYFAEVEGRRRHAAFTYAAISAGIPLCTMDALRSGRAAAMDLTNQRFRAMGHDVPQVEPEDAGRALARLARDYDLTVFEFFLTDMAGHRRWNLDPVAVVERLDRAFGASVEASDLAETLIVLTSDHGNIEDGTTDVHTHNPVPLVAVGARAEQVASSVRSIADVSPAILAVLEAGQSAPIRRPPTAGAC
ncbi:MAG: hypothetical protein QN163_09235 [Armatimonadota bacterium]|nr:hypothetical protein [Armatimonadota bacterium]MDR5698003.1 hypothetical protein [Armatimonadota bacterium]